MSEHDDLLTDAEREALAALSEPPPLAQAVLVVDDNLLNREALRLYLQSRGLTCFAAEGTCSAMRCLRAEPSIGLLVTDLRMEPHDGLELIRQVRASERAALPIIVVSGNTDVKEAVDVMHLGVVDFLLKPVDLPRLLILAEQELGVVTRE